MLHSYVNTYMYYSVEVNSMDLLNDTNMHDKQIFDWGEIIWLHEPIESPNRRLSVAQVKIYPRCTQERHFHLGEEQLFYVIQGKGCFITNGKKEIVSKFMTIYIQPYSEHEVLNTGKEDLIFIIVYVPTKLIQLEKPYILTMHKTIHIQDVISIEILQNIKEQLSELLKLKIHIYDGNHQLLTRYDEENNFCKLCSTINQCSKRKHVSDSANRLSDKMYKCDYDLIELEIPITINDNILGYIKSGNFTLSNSKEIEKNLQAIGEKLEINSDIVLASYKKVPNIIKSRIYVIHEHLAIAAQFIQEMLEQSILEYELTEKDNKILESTKEKMRLKKALKKANNKIYNEKIFAGDFNITKEIEYPYKLEFILENAIKGCDIEKVKGSISKYRNQYIDSDKIVQEMIIVLSRTALRSLGDIKTISYIRKKCNRYLQQIKTEDPWDILEYFCFDCIEEYNKAIQSNGRELIDNINMYINTHYKEDLTLNLVAEAFYISPNYLSTLFNEENNISFSNYIQNLRIEEGKNYLRTTKLNVSEIAKKVGYKSSSYFVNVFKKNVGMTPNEYRKKMMH